MKKIFDLKKLLCKGLIFSLAFGLFAAEKKDSKIQPRYALIIGNQNYDVNPLDSTIKDAQLMKKTLEECCFNVSYYIDLSKDELDKAIEEYSEEVAKGGENAVSLFYYAGHGVQIDGKNYLVPTNDKEIVTETQAKMKCFKVDDLFEYVPAKTHIFILDACRNNPFKNTKQNFARGLSAIQAPQGKNFLYLFATQAGETAADGEVGGNSLFTTILAREMMETNVSINSVFAEVSSEVYEKSNQKQRPLYTGTSINFELMNEDVANWKLSQLKESLEKLKADEKKETNTETKKEYSTRQKLIDAQIKEIQDRKEKSIKDAELRSKEEKERKEREKEVQKEADKTKKEAEKARRQAQENRAREQSSYNFIAEIEKNKKSVQELRQSALIKIINSDEDIDADIGERIENVKNREHSITEKDADGKLTKSAQKKEDEEIKKIKEDGEKQKQKTYEIYYDPIKEEEKDLIQQIEKDKNTLKSKTYVASSFINELSYEVIKQYDGGKRLWNIRVNSNLFDDTSLINEKIEIPYQSLDKKDPEKDAEYDQKVTLFNQLLLDKENTPFEVRVEYNIKAVDGKVSTYLFTAKSLSVYYCTDGVEKKLNTKKITSTREIRWSETTQIIDLETMVANYQKSVADNNKKELQRKKEAQRRSDEEAKFEEFKRREDERKKSFDEKKFKYNAWSYNQIPVDGLVFGMGGTANGLFVIETGWAFPIGNNFYVGPSLLLGSGKEIDDASAKGSFFLGFTAFAGASYSFDFNNKNSMRTYWEISPRLDSFSKFGFNTCIGIDYIYDRMFSVGMNLGFDYFKLNGCGLSYNAFVTVPLETLQSLF